jgi:hypothetical protein
MNYPAASNEVSTGKSLFRALKGGKLSLYPPLEGSFTSGGLGIISPTNFEPLDFQAH